MNVESTAPLINWTPNTQESRESFEANATCDRRQTKSSLENDVFFRRVSGNWNRNCFDSSALRAVYFWLDARSFAREKLKTSGRSDDPRSTLHSGVAQIPLLSALSLVFSRKPLAAQIARICGRT
ncbi:uncharacterized protein [Drosophila takahashii]|uniref:uncharacterized protein n=1 Tax=Drosophila takahashii TaxID=29030 RepID=UPI00389911E4